MSKNSWRIKKLSWFCLTRSSFITQMKEALMVKIDTLFELKIKEGSIFGENWQRFWTKIARDFGWKRKKLLRWNLADFWVETECKDGCSYIENWRIFWTKIATVFWVKKGSFYGETWRFFGLKINARRQQLPWKLEEILDEFIQ